jgi:DUF971 family protein
MTGALAPLIDCATGEGREAAASLPGIRIPSMPEEIRLDADGRRLWLVWSTAIQAALPSALLRQRCGCAECRSARRRGPRVQPAADVRICAVQPCGPGAVQLVFSDGHSRGIFPFAYLASLASATGDDPRG